MARPARDSQGGFALIDMSLALVLLGLLAALALPRLARPVGMGLLRANALEVAGLLREDRTAALNSGRSVKTSVVAEGTAVQSGANAARVDLPPGATAISQGIRFYPNGHTSGGSIDLRTENARIIISVDAVSGAIDARAE